MVSPRGATVLSLIPTQFIMHSQADPREALKASQLNLSCQGVGAIKSFLHFDIIHVDYSPLTSLKLLLLSVISCLSTCVDWALFYLINGNYSKQ